MSPGERDGGAAALAEALANALGRPVAGLRPIAGGDLNDAYEATLASSGGALERVFVKTSADAAPGAFAAEATGLRWLAAARALPLPQPLAVVDDVLDTDPPTAPPAAAEPPTAPPQPAAPSRRAAAAQPAAPRPRFLALRWIEAGSASPASDEALGRGLAELHAAGAPSFGGPGDLLRIGPLTLPNEPAADWPAFYAERRLLPLARLAQDRGALPPGAPAALDRVVARLRDDDLAGPPEPAARLHGDLWGGNVLVDRDGRPWLIDPAAHGGHREVDLAMLRLFAAPSRRCFEAYEEVAPLADGAVDRVGLWQLAPLLLHAALFGGGYGDRAAAVLRSYA
jgi:fructosamine-3-kinase